MFHLELFSSSIASGANTFAQVTYVSSDAVLQKLVNGMQVSPQLPFLMAVAHVGAHAVHCRAQSNSMLPFPYITLDPNNRGTAFESPPRIWDFSAHPVPLKPTEEFDVYATQNAGSGETQYIACLFCDGPPQPIPTAILPPSVLGAAVAGRFLTVHWTASTTLTAGGWTQVTPSLDQALYAGYYALVGARAFSATGLFFRMFPSFGPLWRPGGVAVQAYDQMDPHGQRFTDAMGFTLPDWGIWLYFYSNMVPAVEFFATSADTAEEGWFDLLYLGPQTIMGTL